MKYLRKYQSHSNYSGDYNNIKDLNVCVSIVKDECAKTPDSNEIKNKIFFKSKSYNAWAGDILAWNTNDNKWLIYKVDHDETKYTNKTLSAQLSELHLVPDAVCVVPACHTEDGKARWCALNDVYNESLAYDPSESHHYFKWAIGSYNDTTTPAGKLIPELGTYCLFPRSKFIDSNNDGIFDDISNTEMSNTPYTYDENMPVALYITEIGSNMKLNPAVYDQFMSELGDLAIKPSFSPVNNINLMAIRTLEDEYPVLCGPWAYGNDGFSKNLLATQFYKQNNTEGYNVGADFDGFKNTQILLKLSSSGNEYPAALAAAHYSQTYSPAGSWYLPSAGELIYLIARWYTIQHTLYLLNPDCLDDYNADPNTPSRLDCGYLYWSSTLYSAGNAVDMSTNSGLLGANSKLDYHYVRPFRSF